MLNVHLTQSADVWCRAALYTGKNMIISNCDERCIINKLKNDKKNWQQSRKKPDFYVNAYVHRTVSSMCAPHTNTICIIQIVNNIVVNRHATTTNERLENVSVCALLMHRAYKSTGIFN